MIGILKYVISSVFVCGWIFWLLNIMWLEDYEIQRDDVLQRVASLRADPDTKQKKELLKIALDYEQRHTEILNWPFEIALEHFLSDERKFRDQAFLTTQVRVNGLSDTRTLRSTSQEGIGGVHYVPISIQVEGASSLSHTYFSQYLKNLLSTDQVLVDKIDFKGNSFIIVNLSFLGTFPRK